MYYIKCFLMFSLLGFIMESVVYKVSNCSCHSGVLLGPYTLVYGIGGLLTVIIYNYINQYTINSLLKVIILFISFTIICTLTEYIIGNLIHYIFDIDKWNYTNHKYHFGKYICLDLALTWGFLSTTIIYFIKPFLDKVMQLISNRNTIIILLIVIVDLLYTLFTKAYK